MMVGAIVGTIAIVLVTVVIGLFVDRKVAVLPRAETQPERKALPTTHAPGEAAATALVIRGDAQLAKLREAQRCPACRAPMRGEPDDHVRYGDSELLVLAFHCTSCSGKRTLYVDTQ